jgi:hypothetical protein
MAKVFLVGSEKELTGAHTVHACYKKDDKGFDVNQALVFNDGVAECDDNLAQFLKDQGQVTLEAAATKAKV